MAKSMLEMINNVLIEVLGTIAEEERIKIRKRQAEGIAIAKANGKYTGRKSITVNELPKEFGKLYKQWQQKKITATQFKSLLNLKSRTTLYKYMKIYETGL
jgi:DNA invertase Pin-like site-specific DNA recombinase